MMIANVANSILSASMFSQSMKTDLVTQLLKKPGLDTTDFKHFQPITNLTIISKIIERLDLHRLRPHMVSSPNYCELQSAYCTGLSTDTALVNITDDVLNHVDDGSVFELVSLDISAAFDILNHDQSPNRLHEEFSITGASKDWIVFYHSARSFSTIII